MEQETLEGPRFPARSLPTMALPGYYSKKRRNRFIILGLLAASLIGILALFLAFVVTKEAPLPMVEEDVPKGRIAAPEFLFVITGGPDDLALKKPLDVAIHPNGDVYITTGTLKYGKGRVEVTDADGNFKFAFDNIRDGTLKSPVGIAISPTGKVYVSDVRKKAVYIFSATGKYEATFIPDKKSDFVWSPLGLAFDTRGNLYVTDTYSEHRLLVFDTQGNLKNTIGTMGATNKKGQLPGKFYFPNDVFVDRKDGRVFVADSNNRRVQVFSPQGKYLYTVETAGLPRGIWVDRRDRLYVVDALGHDVSVFKKTDKEGPAMAIFGEQGVEFGQLLYPNGMTLDAAERRIYVTNRENDRVEVWGWPVIGAAQGTVRKVLPLVPLIIPPGLFLVWLLTRRRRFFVDQKFLNNMVNHEHIRELKGKGGKVFAHPEVYEKFKNYVEHGIVAGDIIRPVRVDPSLVTHTENQHGLKEELATLFAKAGRGWTKPRILSEHDDAHRVAFKLNIESMDHKLFTEFYDIKTDKK